MICRCSGASRSTSAAASSQSRTRMMAPCALPARRRRWRRAAGWAARRRPRAATASAKPASSVIRMDCAASSCSAWASRSMATRRGSLGGVGEHHHLGGAGDAVDADAAEHLALGLGDIGVAGADDAVHRGDGGGAVGQRRHRLRAADAVDFGHPGAARRGQHQRVQHAVRASARTWRCAPPRRRGPEWRSSAPRTDRPPCRPARTARPRPAAVQRMPSVRPVGVGHAQIGGKLGAVERLDAGGGEVERGVQLGRHGGDGGVDLVGADAQARRA